MNSVKKLITHEDRFHFHKSCGIYVLANFCFQLNYYLSYRDVILTKWIILPHALLPLTSFFFRVLSKRPVERRMNMFIWNELRLHAILFSLRSIGVILWPQHAVSITFATMMSADLATYLYGTPGVSTVRGKHTNIKKRKWTKTLSGVFFSSSQLAATILCLGIFQQKISPVLVFFTLPAIQTSAFGMTLIRKNIVTHRFWTIAYSLELCLVYGLWYLEYGDLRLLWMGLLAYVLRRICYSKYVLWIGLVFLDSLL